MRLMLLFAGYCQALSSIQRDSPFKMSDSKEAVRSYELQLWMVLSESVASF